MKIQKGIVKYKDRNDIVCTYAVTDDGKQYYFLDEKDEKKLANGGRIASTELIEAIDPMVKSTHIGVIGNDGREIIPFRYKSIKSIDESTLLVELAEAVSPSVLEAIGLKSDPLAATKLVSTPATIKDKINSKMGADGRYLFNDQFSDATICDIDGNNLVGDQYYSFIGLNNGKLFLSKNVIDTDVVEFSLPSVSAKEQIKVDDVQIPSSVVEEAMSGNPSDSLNSTSDVQSIVPQMPNVVEDSAEQEETVDNTEAESDAPVKEETSNGDVSKDTSVVTEPVDNNEEVIEETTNAVEKDKIVSVEDSSAQEETVATDADNSSEDTKASVEDKMIEEEDIVDSSVASETDEVVNDDTVDAVEKDAVDIDSTDKEDFNNITDVNENGIADNVEEDLDLKLDFDTDKELEGVVVDSIDDEISNADSTDYSEVIGFGSNEDLLDDEKMFDNSAIDTPDATQESYFNESNNLQNNNDSIMSDVVTSLTNLLKQNKSQKNIISQYQDRLDKVMASRKNLFDKYKIQEQKMVNLVTKNRTIEANNNKLEARIQMLENRLRDQERVIANQNQQLESLRPKKEDLAKLVADAQALLGADNDYEDSYFGQTA